MKATANALKEQVEAKKKEEKAMAKAFKVKEEVKEKEEKAIAKALVKCNDLTTIATPEDRPVT
jgi:hypothetical protein